MLIFVFICKGTEEKGAIWAAVGGFFRIFPGSFSGGRGFLEGFWRGDGIWRGDLGRRERRDRALRARAS